MDDAKRFSEEDLKPKIGSRFKASLGKKTVALADGEEDRKATPKSDRLSQLADQLLSPAPPLVRKEFQTLEESTIFSFTGKRKVTRPVDVQTSKAEIVKDFLAKQQELSKVNRETAHFLHHLVSANLEFRTKKPTDARTIEAIVRGFVKESDAILPSNELSQSLADIAMLPDIYRIRSLLTDRIQREMQNVLGSLFTGLDRLHDFEKIGRIEWLSKDVCRLYGYRWIIKEEILGVHQSSQNHGTHTEFITDTDLKRSLNQALHYHELMDAHLVSIDTQVKMPARVRQLIKVIPQKLKSLCAIVVGEEIYRRVIEREISSEVVTETERRNQWHHDPAILLDNKYVLTIWGDDEA